MGVQNTDLAYRIAALPPIARQEVDDFVQFLSEKNLKQAAWDYLLAIAPMLEHASQTADEATVR